jgi:hypothetical protein
MVQLGTYAELLSSSASFARLLEDINQHEQEQKHEYEQQQSITRRMSRVGSVCVEKEDEEDSKTHPTNIETKQEGTVKWHVYVAYLRAGIGLILGFLLIAIVFSTQQGIYLYNNWWLAQWSDDESHRFRVANNCTNVLNQKMERIRLMNETEWNVDRAHRFYWFSSKLNCYS